MVGLDVYLDETSLPKADGSGRIVRETKGHTDPDAIAAAVKRPDTEVMRVGPEVGPPPLCL